MIACAAALAMLDAIENDKLLARAGVMGERIRTSLGALAKKVDRIGEVRGLGAMVAIELFKDASRAGAAVSPGRTGKWQARWQRAGTS
ncbi:MAG: aminotransferase class III-fold pyridoxal phosphate-dependent enzyme [Burkholderiaceae bacterium]|nr:aminotransferase class III-fold pyridoxal phosphate-dependent enzyme [Burkholderiaceae bacterium]